MELRNFIYLDTEKLYSISSQLFNGFTEEVISENGTDITTDENQKMSFTSGKTLGHLFTEATKSKEKKFLHDQSFVILENKLMEDNQLLKIDSNNSNIVEEILLSKPFISITAKVRFDDYAELASLLHKFNDIGEAIAYFSNKEQLDNIKKFKDSTSSISDRNQKAKVLAELKKVPSLHELALSQGLNLEKDFLDYLIRMVDYMYEDEFSFTQIIDNYVFTSFINRGYLRDSERMLMRKYQFSSHKKLTIVGQISQIEHVNDSVSIPLSDDGPNIKDAFINLFIAKRSLDSMMVKSNTNEIIIDPIAAYFE